MISDTRNLTELFNHGVRYLGSGGVEKADACFSRIIWSYLQQDAHYAPAKKATVAEAFYLLGKLAFQGCNTAEALLNYQVARDLGFEADDLDAKIALGMSRLGLSDTPVTEPELDQVIAQDFNALLDKANRFIELEDTQIAEKYLKKALEIAPNDGIAFFELGKSFYAARLGKEAIQAYRTSIRLYPNLMSYIALANLYEKSNDLKSAVPFAEFAVRHFPDDARPDAFLATCEIRDGKEQAALGRLEKALAKAEDPDDKGMILNLMAKAYDRQDKIDEAYQAFQAAKDFQKQTSEYAEANQDYLVASTALYETLDIRLIPSHGDLKTKHEPGQIVFFIGFPRSGTTLVHQILNAHPDIQVVEERAMLTAPLRVLEQMNGDYPSCLARLTPNTVRHLRKLYFLEASKHLTLHRGGVFVDKMPLNLVHVPAILTLFPDAKFLFGLRHPKAVVLSNLIQYFELNPGMASLMSLDEITASYQAVMGAWKKIIETAQVSFHTIRYEDVISGLEAETRKLTDFLGLEWSPAMLEYRKVAKSKGLINTPSYHQVIQPLYSKAVERWRHYDKYLKPFEDRLAPFVKEFGYD